MEQARYDIYFTGKLVEGVAESDAQAGLAALFKTTADNVAKLFNGKPQILKRNVDKATALKYKAALHQAGLTTAFKAHPPAVKATTPIATAPKPSAVASEAAQAVTSDSLSLAPAGSDVLRDDEKHIFEPRDIDTSAIKLSSPFLDIIDDSELSTPQAPDTSHISVAEVGADVLAEKPVAPIAPTLDLSGMTLAEAGADLEEIKDQRSPLHPDISNITLAEAGTDLATKKKKDEVAAPNTDHLKLEE